PRDQLPANLAETGEQAPAARGAGGTAVPYQDDQPPRRPHRRRRALDGNERLCRCPRPVRPPALATDHDEGETARVEATVVRPGIGLCAFDHQSLRSLPSHDLGMLPTMPSTNVVIASMVA